jgi:hypothetical protein
MKKHHSTTPDNKNSNTKSSPSERGTPRVPSSDPFNGPETSTLLEALEYRQTAIAYIQALSQLAKGGDQFALNYLRHITDLAVVELEAQPIEARRVLAASVIQWPVMLSISKAMNKKVVDEKLNALGLGRDLTIPTKTDTIGVKATPLKEIVIRIFALLMGLKNEHDAMLSCREIGSSIRMEGLGEDAVEYATNLANRDWTQHKRLTGEKIEGICDQLGIDTQKVGGSLEALRAVAIGLREFTSNKAVQDEWFETIMKVLEGFTGSRYDKKRYNLQGQCGFVVMSEKDAEERQGEIRIGLRDKMKKAFHNMVSDDFRP